MNNLVQARRVDNGNIQVTVLDGRRGGVSSDYMYPVQYSGHPQEDLEKVVRVFSQHYLVARVEKHTQRDASQTYVWTGFRGRNAQVSASPLRLKCALAMPKTWLIAV